MAVLRLARTQPATSQDEDPVVAEAVQLALSGGAAVRLEARVWAAVDLLHRPGRRQDGLALAREVTAELETRGIHGELAAQWRLLLAFHTGQAGDTALAQRLLAAMINTGPAEQRDAAAAVLRAIGGPHADTQLQVILLNDELTRTPADADDDLLRLHHALADSYVTLGDYRRALHHGSQELPLRCRIQGNDHPDTLTARGNIANWTGHSGDAAGALRVWQELLPDRLRVLGPRHRDTLVTRHNIAAWTGRCGDAAGALRLSQDLLPDQVRVLGPRHPDTLTTRSNIANWTGQRGNAAGALRLSQDLLPDQVRVLGPRHPDTLTTRHNIAFWTGQCGDAAGALRLSQDLLPDQVRVLGPGHPDTLATRHNIATWTGRGGDAAGALRLFQDLLPDHGAGAWPGPPRHPGHPQQHRVLDRRARRRGGGAAPDPGPAARPGAGAGPRPPRAPWPPAATSRTGPATAGTRRRRCACPRNCCPTWCGYWAQNTPTPWPPAATSRTGRRFRREARHIPATPPGDVRPGAGPGSHGPGGPPRGALALHRRQFEDVAAILASLNRNRA